MAEMELAFRPYPGVYIPLGDESYSVGFGGAAALDLRFFPAFGVSAQGEFISMRTRAESSMILLDGSLGPTIVWRPIGRFSLTADITGGVYTAQWNGQSISGISAGGRLSAALHISPAVSIMAYGGY
jgi:hypothetical protein